MSEDMGMLRRGPLMRMVEREIELGWSEPREIMVSVYRRSADIQWIHILVYAGDPNWIKLSFSDEVTPEWKAKLQRFLDYECIEYKELEFDDDCHTQCFVSTAKNSLFIIVERFLRGFWKMRPWGRAFYQIHALTEEEANAHYRVDIADIEYEVVCLDVDFSNEGV